MSTSIDELISEASARCRVYDVVRERFPEAPLSRLPNGDVCLASDGKFADSVQFMAAKDGRVYVVLYTAVSIGAGIAETTRIYERDSLSMPFPTILLKLDDETHAQLVAAVRRA